MIGRFSSEALIPFSYEGGVYALPCTQSFPMLFYRKDIFEELGFKPPQTWEDVYRIAAVLQRNNLTIGIGSDIGTFATLLYQKGGSFYNDELSATELNSESAMGAFAQWTDFFQKYSLPLSFDFQNRFRTGKCLSESCLMLPIMCFRFRHPENKRIVGNGYNSGNG